MKCKYCGAEISSASKVCPYCNSEVVEEKPVTNITNNYYGVSEQSKQANIACPKCGSLSIKFKREELGNTKSKVGKRVYYQTVGICQDCGYTWTPHQQEQKKKHSVWWWILVVIFYPISLSVWFYKTPKLKLDKRIRIAIIAGVWILLAVIGILSPDPETSTVSNPSSQTIATQGEPLSFQTNDVDLGKNGAWESLKTGESGIIAIGKNQFLKCPDREVDLELTLGKC